MEALLRTNNFQISENEYQFSTRQWKGANEFLPNIGFKKITNMTYKELEVTSQSLHEESLLSESLKLSHLEEQIKEAKDFIRSGDYLKEGDSDPVQMIAFNNAISFLRNYAIGILIRYNQFISVPYIDVLKDGSISVDWQNQKAKFLIIFKNSNRLAYFYGERGPGIPYKGAIEMNDNLDESLLVWMKEHLT